jgi:metallo-beta-lactamase class B
MFARIWSFPALLALALPTAGSVMASAPPATDTADQQAWAAACKDSDEWDQPGPPFRIFGNSYYVGTCGIAAILVTGDAGHILIDSGTEAGAGIVVANVARLGFVMTDVKLLLHSHEHHDHIGGMARLQRLSGARLIASSVAAPVMASGQASRDDPQFGINPAFAPARVDALLDPSMMVQLGSLRLTAIDTPGHTPGALSWRWTSCEGTMCKALVYADSLSPYSAEDYRFADHKAYLGAYIQGLGRLAAADCDIVLTPHPSASAMRERLLDGGLENGQGCLSYAGSLMERLAQRMEQEMAGQTP